MFATSTVSTRRMAVLILAAGACIGIASPGLAQQAADRSTSGQSAQQAEPAPDIVESLADKLEEFGQDLFGGIFPSNNKTRSTQQPSATARARFSSRRRPGSPSNQRAGSILTRQSDTESDPAQPQRVTEFESATRDRSVAASQSFRQTGHPTRRGTQPDFDSGDEPGADGTSGRERTAAETAASTEEADQRILTALANPSALPLHERLKAFRHSVFQNNTQAKPVQRGGSGSLPAGQRGSHTSTEAATLGSPTRATPQTPTPARRQTPTLAKPRDSITTEPETQGSRGSTNPSAPTVMQEDSTHTGRTRSPGIVGDDQPEESPYTDGEEDRQMESPSTTGRAMPTPAGRLSNSLVRGSRPSTHPMGTTARNVLFSRRSPVLSVETVGPQRISVGKESSYLVNINNAGEAAEEVMVYVDLPPWADVLGAEVTTGEAPLPNPNGPPGPLQWKLGHLPAQGREQMALKIVPRQSRPFDLAVRWNYKPVVSQAMIEVQEPNLVLNLEGPREILYGEKEVYKLRLSNVGTGAAENVLITLQPAGADQNQTVSHNLGIVGAGQQRSIEVELVARQIGDLTIQVQARADAGVHAELVEKVLVRRAALQVDVQGPEVEYVGAAASYQIDISNPGTAPATNVKLSVSLPPGAKYLSGIEGSRLGANGTKVEWTLDRLDPAARQTYLLKCSLSAPGPARMSVVATADGELTALADATTRVEAMADLVLDVKDPSGPVPVGEETTYEVRIRNRGTLGAQDVDVVAYFSRGIEPTAAEGGQYTITPGQVVFRPIQSLAAGEELVLLIRARAETAGNHVFRAEVHCKALGVRLVSEESTHYYQSGPVAQRPSSAE